MALKKLCVWATEMIQWGKVLATKLGVLSLISGIHMAGESQLLHVTLCPLSPGHICPPKLISDKDKKEKSWVWWGTPPVIPIQVEGWGRSGKFEANLHYIVRLCLETQRRHSPTKRNKQLNNTPNGSVLKRGLASVYLCLPLA